MPGTIVSSSVAHPGFGALRPKSAMIPTSSSSGTRVTEDFTGPSPALVGPSVVRATVVDLPFLYSPRLTSLSRVADAVRFSASVITEAFSDIVLSTPQIIELVPEPHQVLDAAVMASETASAALEAGHDAASHLVPNCVARFFRNEATFPEQPPRHTSDARIMDGQEYLQPFCLTCSAEQFAVLCRLPDAPYPAGVYKATCAVPRCCRRCNPFYDGMTLDLLEERTFFFPGEDFLTWKSMGMMKLGHDKKNFQVGWTAAMEVQMRRTDFPTPSVREVHLLRCQALMDFLPFITLLQATPAVSVPRVVRLAFPSCVQEFMRKPIYVDRSEQYNRLLPSQVTSGRRRYTYATAWRPLEEEDYCGPPPLPPPATPPSPAPPVPVNPAFATLPPITSLQIRPQASHPLTQLQSQVDERDGVVPSRVQRVTQAEAEAAGIQGIALPEALPSSGPPEMSADGRHELTDTPLAYRTAPIIGNPVVFDNTSEHNLAAVVTERIGGIHAEKRTFLWQPTPDMIKDGRSCLNVLLKRVFTQENVLRWALELGTTDQLFDPKLSEKAARALITDIQAGYELKRVLPVMVKREVTAKSSKPPRGIVDAGLATFVASAQVLKIIEAGLSEFDEPANIKHRAKDVVLDSISTECTRDYVFSGPGCLAPGTFAEESFRFLESDYTRFEFSQALEFTSDQQGRVEGWRVPKFTEHEMGMLYWERELIRHVSKLLPSCLFELQTQSEQVNVPQDVRSKVVPKLKPDPSKFTKPCWSLVMHLLFRSSGQGQTSWGNRLNNSISMAVSTLKSPSGYFARLADFLDGTRPKYEAIYPSTWCFISRWGERIRWRCWMEGDDFKAHIAGSKELSSDPEQCDLQHLPNWKGVLDRLNLFGLEPKMVMYRSGRAEFVGGHLLAEDGFSIRGAWCPDVARGLVTSSVGTSDAMKGDTPVSRMQVALSYKSRAAMFRGRVSPLYEQYNSYAAHWYARAHGAENAPITLDWKLSQQLGLPYGQRMPAREVWDSLEGQDGLTLPTNIQLRLVEASVGGKITAAEWGTWMAAVPSVDDHPTDVLACLPAAVRNAIPP